MVSPFSQTCKTPPSHPHNVKAWPIHLLNLPHRAMAAPQSRHNVRSIMRPTKPSDDPCQIANLTFITSFVRSSFVHNALLSRVILAARIETTDFSLKNADFRFKSSIPQPRKCMHLNLQSTTWNWEHARKMGVWRTNHKSYIDWLWGPGFLGLIEWSTFLGLTLSRFIYISILL